MAKRLQLRRGTAAEINAFTGVIGEPTYNETYKTIVVHDGVTKGGIVLAKVHEIPSLVPQATETEAGKAKIATTAIAQAMDNDTDILTPKKLRDALNASGSAPVSACRAWVNVDCTVTPANIKGNSNILSVIVNSRGDITLTFKEAMPHNSYAVFGMVSDTAYGGGGLVKVLATTINSTEPLLKTTTQVRIGVGSGGDAYTPKNLSIGVFC